MTDKMKLYHKMYPEWFPNSMLLKGFSNLLTAYMPHRRGKIIDIGCGPNSCYILDLLKSDFELYAEDIDATLIDYLKERIVQSNEKVERVNFSTEKFPVDFENVIFDGVIVSNLLHLITSEEEAELVENVKKHTKKYSVIVVTVHSDSHRSNTEDNPNRFDYFKRYYKKSNLYKLFPPEEFDYLFISETHVEPTPYDIQFIKEWMTEHLKTNKRVSDPVLIEKAQAHEIEKNVVDSTTVVVRKK